MKSSRNLEGGTVEGLCDVLFVTTKGSYRTDLCLYQRLLLSCLFGKRFGNIRKRDKNLATYLFL